MAKDLVDEDGNELLEWDDIAVDKDGKEYNIHFKICRNEINMEVFDKLKKINSWFLLKNIV